jgi:hypothetical protein
MNRLTPELAMTHELPDNDDWQDDFMIDDLPTEPLASEVSQPDRDDWQDDFVIDDLPADAVATSRELATTRHLLAVVITIGFTLTAVLVVVGGLAGRFGSDVVGPVVAALAASQSAVAYFFFRGAR